METFRPFNYAMPALIAAETILREHGFFPMAYNPWTRELTPLLLPNEGTQNTIYVRDSLTVGAHLKEANPVYAFGAKI